MNESIPNWSVRRFTQCIEIVQISALCIFFVCSRSQKKISPTRIITPWTLDKNHAKKPPAFEPRTFSDYRVWILRDLRSLRMTIWINGSPWAKKETPGINQAFFNSYAISIWERRVCEQQTPRINEAWSRENPPARVFHRDSSGFGLKLRRAEPSLV